LAGEPTRKSSCIHARYRKNVLWLHVVEIQPQHQRSEQLDGTSRGDSVVIKSRGMAYGDVLSQDADILDQKLFDSLRTSHGFTKTFRSQINAMSVLVEQNVSKT